MKLNLFKFCFLALNSHFFVVYPCKIFNSANMSFEKINHLISVIWFEKVLSLQQCFKRDASKNENFHRMWEQKQHVNLYFLQVSGGFEDVYEFVKYYIRWCMIFVEIYLLGLGWWKFFKFSTAHQERTQKILTIC